MLHVRNVRVERGPDDIEDLVHVRLWIDGHMTKAALLKLQEIIEVHYKNGRHAVKSTDINVTDFLDLLRRNEGR